MPSVFFFPTLKNFIEFATLAAFGGFFSIYFGRIKIFVFYVTPRFFFHKKNYVLQL